jgi:hypothetical protein
MQNKRFENVFWLTFLGITMFWNNSYMNLCLISDSNKSVITYKHEGLVLNQSKRIKTENMFF